MIITKNINFITMIEIPENYLVEINDIAKRRIDEEMFLIARMNTGVKKYGFITYYGRKL
jgi:hypothetical protein